MASSIMDALTTNGICLSSNIICSDISELARTQTIEKGYYTTADNQEVCKMSKDAIVLAVKPQYIETVCNDIMSNIDNKDNTNDTPIISIAAGITLSKLESYLPNRRIIRVMPNTPCLVGEAASGYALGSHAIKKDQELVERLFNAVGTIIHVKESLLDGVTGLSGSGPAYVFQFIEALSDGGVKVGLPRDVSTQLAAQTVKGAAEMVLKTGQHPGELKDAVTSPGGTTICGIHVLEKGNMRGYVMEAVKRATRRSLQLAGMTNEEIEMRLGV